MREITIEKNDAGQRLDKFLGKYMRLAGKSFLYKMLRKKNITLNGKKCEGSEKLAEGDVVRLFLSDETIEKFSDAKAFPVERENRNRKLPDMRLDILYEDGDILLVNKPAGMLSQKADKDDVSLVEYLIAYLLEKGAVTPEELTRFRPSVCNRLDRNTSGIVAAGKSLAGLQLLSRIFRDRSIHKYYLCIVAGAVKEEQTIDGWLSKNEAANQVRILTEKEAAKLRQKQGTEKPLPIRTKYEPLSVGKTCTLLKITLYTGRSHQIRAHLASVGHPILGDAKYGDPGRNRTAREAYGVKTQLLHSFRLEFPALAAPFEALSGRTFEAALPEEFLRVLSGEGMTWEQGHEEIHI